MKIVPKIFLFFLYDNLEKIQRSWDQNQPYPKSKRVIND